MNFEVYNKYKYIPSELADSLYFYIEELIKQHSTSLSIFENAFDFKCNLELLPIKDKTLFMLYTQKKEYQSIFGYVDKDDIEHSSEKYPQISPYMYYNNSDRPNTLTKEEWDNRRENWNKALRKNNNGFKYDLVKVPYIYKTNILTEKIEAMYEKRLQRLAFSKIKDIFNESHKHLIKDNNIGDFILIVDSDKTPYGVRSIGGV